MINCLVGNGQTSGQRIEMGGTFSFPVSLLDASCPPSDRVKGLKTGDEKEVIARLRDHYYYYCDRLVDS
jgi:hypothetical protein